ncbi:alpha/beta hydrolase [Hydrogenophaga sp. 2FB]|uniref:serine aminopeptidase domain-containing protein n=1 Tax=Hydrogenophaga sp. 2FB TaxID=2502187 RepID=UPI0010F443EB|nr:alpha/beta hydrolase [Hydrogenophaga sp. 2FB]
MSPFRFGPQARQLYGIFHPANPRRPTGMAVLLCNPFGQEAVRLHRLYRVLADRLSHHGTHVMRFDYFGTGESSGDDEEGELGGWCADLQLADHELRQRSADSRVSWVGARLGATLAALASTNAPRAPDTLVLWEPILNGPAYLKELAGADAKSLDSLLRKPTAPTSPNTEFIGFGVGPKLVAQVEQLDVSPLSAARARQTVVIHNPTALQQPTLKAVLTRMGSSCHAESLRHTFDWTSEEALNTALVPADALKLLQTSIDRSAP